MILFRTDIDPAQGSIHFNRCVYLASLLKHRTPVRFCSVDRSVSRWLKARKFPVSSPEEVMSRQNTEPFSLLFDLENFSARDLELMRWARDQSVRTVQITDLGLNPQPVDYTIDGSPQPMTAYGPDKSGLFGPEYVILHSRFRHFHQVRRRVSRTVKNLFLCPGRNLHYRELRDWVELLINHGFRIKIFPEPWMKKSHRKILKRKYPALKYVGRAESRARPFFEADLALVPADRSAFEAAACGTPALYFCQGPEQEFLADRLAERGCGDRIRSEKPDRDLLDRIRSLDGSRREEMSARGKQTVDGRGVYRIIDFLIKQAII